jgi:hypothetical protein
MRQTVGHATFVLALRGRNAKRATSFSSESPIHARGLAPKTDQAASAFSTQVLIDQLNVRAALLKFRYDIVTNTAAMLADCSSLQAADLKKDTILAPLFKAFRKEVKAMRHTLEIDRLTESSAVLTDEGVIVGELAKYASDAGNESARAADRIQLRKDRIQMQTDEIAGLNARLTTRETEETALTADLNAVTTALGTDTGASSGLVTVVNTFITDRTSSLALFQTDLKAIIAARTQLSADLTASLSSTAST